MNLANKTFLKLQLINRNDIYKSLILTPRKKPIFMLGDAKTDVPIVLDNINFKND